MGAKMRIRQGVRALLTWSRPVDNDLAAAYLTPPLFALFQKMRRSERQHSLNVLRTLRERGYDHPALMVAALLHDAGKSRVPFFLPDRVIVVLTRALFPDLARRLGAHPEAIGILNPRRPFAVSYQHPWWSAHMAAIAGADALTVTLIAAHAQKVVSPPRNELERLLAALQAADDLN